MLCHLVHPCRVCNAPVLLCLQRNERQWTWAGVGFCPRWPRSCGTRAAWAARWRCWWPRRHEKVGATCWLSPPPLQHSRQAYVEWLHMQDCVCVCVHVCVAINDMTTDILYSKTFKLFKVLDDWMLCLRSCVCLCVRNCVCVCACVYAPLCVYVCVCSFSARALYRGRPSEGSGSSPEQQRPRDVAQHRQSHRTHLLRQLWVDSQINIHCWNVYTRFEIVEMEICNYRWAVF